MRINDSGAAVVWYQRAIEANGADAAVLVRLAEAQVKTGALDAARATLAKALEKDPGSRPALRLQRVVGGFVKR
jgi:predicted TPR repeat methyltransferase